ncbi:MAG: hypothetical protein MZV70_14240 [Desulfobacterales bacterium]|nr:hypothetical protein [Desulfobacterales bacterium]
MAYVRPVTVARRRAHRRRVCLLHCGGMSMSMDTFHISPDSDMAPLAAPEIRALLAQGVTRVAVRGEDDEAYGLPGLHGSRRPSR